MLPHLVNANQVLGGGLLTSDRLKPILAPEQFADPQHRAPLSSSTRETRTKNKVRTTGDSAEAIRTIKRSLGVACRPTNLPIDLILRN